jgi:hypothetical protein
VLLKDEAHGLREIARVTTISDHVPLFAGATSTKESNVIQSAYAQRRRFSTARR